MDGVDGVTFEKIVFMAGILFLVSVCLYFQFRPSGSRRDE
jgi:hypothetical protein